MTVDDLKELVDKTVVPHAHARYAQAKWDEEFKMQMLEVYDGKDVSIVGFMAPKDVVALVMKLLVFLGADAVVLVSEGWVVRGLAPDEVPAFQKWAETHSFKEHPKSVECQTIAAACHEGRFVVVHDIKREPNKAPELVNRVDSPIGKSRFTDGLPFATATRFAGMKVSDVLKLLSAGKLPL